MKTLITSLALLLATICFADGAELRFTKNKVIGNQLFVDVEMRGSSYDFNLASHNIRAFYNHDVLEMVDVISTLSPAKYDAPRVEQLYTDGHDLSVGLLQYEDHMGFVNMSTSLVDAATGGAVISSDWTSIYTLVFDIKDNGGVAKIAWAQDGVTDEYATAFVEVAEWVSSSDINQKSVFDLINFELDLSKENSSSIEFDVTVGPNPAQSYVKVQTSAADATLSVIDLSGAVVTEMIITDGSETVDVSTYSAGTYIFIITAGAETHSEQIAITK